MCAFMQWRNYGAFKAQKGAFGPDTGNVKLSTLSWCKGTDLNRCATSYYGQLRTYTADPRRAEVPQLRTFSKY